ncbi:MAG: hypothetical protein AABX17_00130 [Nanoarchaeota archaeon]
MVCPVCTVAVAAGIGILEKWGVNNIIIGLWLGALIVSSIAWMIDWLNRKNIHFLFRKILIIVSFYLIFIWPLYIWKIMGLPRNQIFGIDNILLGVIIGSVIFILAMLSDRYLRKINEDKIVIKYQKVLIPLTFLVIASIIAYLLIKITGI